MKQKVLAFVQTIKEIFAKRKANMGKLRHHVPFLDEITRDIEALESSCQTIDSLNEASTSLFATSLFYYVMHLIVPIMRHWQDRFKKIPERESNNVNHINAKKEFEEKKTCLFSLIEEINLLGKQPLCIIDENVEKPGLALIKQFNPDTYLATHPIQEVVAKTQEKRSAI